MSIVGWYRGTTCLADWLEQLLNGLADLLFGRSRVPDNHTHHLHLCRVAGQRVPVSLLCDEPAVPPLLPTRLPAATRAIGLIRNQSSSAFNNDQQNNDNNSFACLFVLFFKSIKSHRQRQRFSYSVQKGDKCISAVMMAGDASRSETMATTVSTEVIKTWERYETLSAFSNKQYLARSLWRLWGWSLLCAHWASWRSRRRRRRRQTVVVRRSILIQACLAVNSYQHLAPLPPPPPPPPPLYSLPSLPLPAP